METLRKKIIEVRRSLGYAQENVPGWSRGIVQNAETKSKKINPIYVKWLSDQSGVPLNVFYDDEMELDIPLKSVGEFTIQYRKKEPDPVSIRVLKIENEIDDLRKRIDDIENQLVKK